ncbi:type I restriction enzyme HsdR N-terminal domain-containing protein [Cytophagaceae bacterium ABcell3]|nr:type I restriction enzyme HsdR N-terminal domain-containing protein [Cytophagaceae bacterium ABcell3]
MIMLTPEEWVRQHFVHLLIKYYHYPKSLIKLESGLRYNKLLKRTDIVIYNRTGECFMIVECKAPEVKIDEKVFSQASVYNQTLKANYILVSNGIKHFCCFIDHKEGTSKFISGIPAFPQPSE